MFGFLASRSRSLASKDNDLILCLHVSSKLLQWFYSKLMCERSMISHWVLWRGCVSSFQVKVTGLKSDWILCLTYIYRTICVISFNETGCVDRCIVMDTVFPKELCSVSSMSRSKYFFKKNPFSSLTYIWQCIQVMSFKFAVMKYCKLMMSRAQFEFYRQGLGNRLGKTVTYFCVSRVFSKLLEWFHSILMHGYMLLKWHVMRKSNFLLRKVGLYETDTCKTTTAE